MRDVAGRQWPNLAERVKGELWDFYRLQAGMDAQADVVAEYRCKKLVTDMFYEQRLQSIINYHAVVLGQKVTKAQARTMTLTEEQYLQMVPHWCAHFPECWQQIVAKWLSDDWNAVHQERREHRLTMAGVPHHQGNRNLTEYAQAWSAAHGGQQCNKFMAYALSHKGKATSSVSYNAEDGPEAYSNPSIYTRLNEYTSMAREVHGQEYDPTQEDLDAEIVMKVGGGKKHGRYWICDGAIDSSSTPTLSQIKARQTSSSAGIRPRPDSSTSQVQALQAQLQEERRERMELEARMRAEMEAEREADRQRMASMFAYIQSLGAATGLPPPPPFVTPPRPPTDPFSTSNQSAASNDPYISPNQTNQNN
ncbi:uncharacterized protein LOC112885361 [Panicum hallii]|uniref:uncharacterized protein LOC112876574 n=2 Tax=Panicum hallii TaxID=206008 RepID=UPI000DF4CBD2|nr:uncharacterized protein LOC112876574 [Panicum hallii]XP_025806780.1 uncharacterized protein LOC112885361 [Panicum hallii]